jgi:hypothetical protein
MDNKTTGSAFDLLSVSYEKVKAHWQLFALANALSIASGLSVLIQGEREQTESIMNSLNIGDIGSSYALGTLLGVGALATLFILVLIGFAVFLYAFQICLELRVARGQQATINILIDDAKKVWLKLFAQTIVSAIIVLFGFLLLIVPGIIAIKRLLMAPYILVDKNIGIVESLKESNELAKTHSGAVWAVFGVVILVSLLSGIMAGIPRVGELIGTIFMIAVSLIIALRYVQLVPKK